MTFLLVVTFLLGIHLAAVLRAHRRPVGLLHWVIGAAGAAAVVGGLGLPDGAERAVRPGDINWSVPLFAAFGAGTAAIFAWKLWALRRQDLGPYAWRAGLSAWALLAGLYLVVAIADHLWFTRGEQSGIAHAAALGATDVDCPGMVLVRWDETTAVYRCPVDLTWGHPLGQPFVPWPTYVEGASDLLRERIEATFREARRIEP
jgi:hypothetical protein